MIKFEIHDYFKSPIYTYILKPAVQEIPKRIFKFHKYVYDRIYRHHFLTIYRLYTYRKLFNYMVILHTYQN
nr:MAG TPA: hypothetical protein [Caudoviricetes sp.]